MKTNTTSPVGISNSLNMPDSARVWIYQSNRAFSEREKEELATLLAGFIAEWAAHGNKLSGSFEILHNHFIAIFLNEALAAASGCSIDTQVRFIQDLERRYNLVLLDRMQVAYRDDDLIRTMSIAEFEKALQNGSLTGETIVFNNLVATVGQFRNQWEVPVSESWHARYLPNLSAK